MKIKVEKWIIDDEISYKILEIKKCCNKLTNSKSISVNSGCDYYSEFDDECGDFTVKLVREVEEPIPWEQDAETRFYYENIKYCPFCGERITIEIVNTIDKTEEYDKLDSELEELWQKCYDTDSKKDDKELKCKITELSNKLNNMLINDDFEREDEKL